MSSLIKENKRGLYIDFKKALSIKDDTLDLTFFCNNEMTKKSFRNRKAEFSEQLNDLIEKMELGEEFFELYFSYVINVKIEDHKVKDIRKSTIEFLEGLKDKLNIFVETLSDSYFSPKRLEEMDTPSKRELYFSDCHLKRLLKIIIASKFLFIPTSIRTPVVEILWSFNFTPEDKDLNIRNKVQKFCYSRILSTIYSDKRFWSIAKLHNIMPLSYGNSLYIEFVTNVCSFVDWNKNPIPFLDVYIHNNITWLKQKNFTHNFVLANSDMVDSKMDSLSFNFDYNFRCENQASNFIISKSIEQMIEVKLRPYIEKNKIYSELLLQIYTKMRRNVIYNYVLFPYIGKVLKISTERLLMLDKKSISMLLLYLVIELEKHNFVLLPKMLASNMTTDKINLDKKRVESYKNIASLLEDPRYLRLIETKFNRLSDIIDDEKYLLKIVATMCYNKFLPFNGGNELNFTSGEVIDELMKFYEIML